jgi:hypothetical protein
MSGSPGVESQASIGGGIGPSRYGRPSFVPEVGAAGLCRVLFRVPHDPGHDASGAALTRGIVLSDGP